MLSSKIVAMCRPHPGHNLWSGVCRSRLGAWASHRDSGSIDTAWSRRWS